MNKTSVHSKTIYLWIALYAVLLGLTLDNTRPYKGDESLYIASSIRMLQTGEYMVPEFFGDFRFQKPILTYWITLAGYKLFGIHLWSGRILFLGLACALLILIYKFAFLILPNHQFARLNVYLLSSSTLFIEFSRVSMTDLPLAFFTTLGLYYFYKALATPEKLKVYYLLAFTSAGFALSAKSFLGVFPVVAMLVYLLFKKPQSFKRYALYMAHPLYWIVMLFLGFAWYGYIYWQYPTDLMNQLGKESATHLSLNLIPLFGHILFYAQTIITYYLPFTALAAYIYLKKRYRFPEQFLLVMLHLAITLMVLVFVVSGHKARYLLLIFPGITLLISYLIYQHNLSALAKKIAIGWAVLQILVFLCFPMISGAPLKHLVHYWEQHLTGDLTSYKLPRKETSWAQALSHGMVERYHRGNGHVIVEADDVDFFEKYEIVHQAVLLQTIRFENSQFVKKYQTYLLIKPSP